MLGVVAADPGALFRFGLGLPDGFAHLACHDFAEVAGAAFEDVGGAAHLFASLVDGRLPVALEGGGGAGETVLDVGLGEKVVGGDFLFRSGVDRRDGAGG